jgi:hypothetical protein
MRSREKCRIVCVGAERERRCSERR